MLFTRMDLASGARWVCWRYYLKYGASFKPLLQIGIYGSLKKEVRDKRQWKSHF
jgi:hypothetical protein